MIDARHIEFRMKTRLVIFSVVIKRHDKPNKVKAINVKIPFREKINCLTVLKCSPTISPKGKAKELATHASEDPFKYIIMDRSMVIMHINER